MDATSFEAVQNGFMSGEGPANTDTLSDAIALGSILLKGRLLWVSATLGFVILGMLLMSCNTCRPHRKLQTVLWKVNEILLQLEKNADGPTPLPGIAPAPDLSSLESPLQCIDAKLLQLQLDKEAREIRRFIASLDSEQALGELEKLMQTNLKVSEVSHDQAQQWQANVPPKINEIHQFCAGIQGMSKSLQATGLEMQKSFAIAETTSDGLMNQNRECLMLLQSDNKATTECLVRAESALDEIKGSIKQLSLDVHVSRTKGEQRLDALSKELKDHVGGLNPLSAAWTSVFRRRRQYKISCQPT